MQLIQSDVQTETPPPPCVIVWENVPGVLSTRDNAFGHFLAAIAGEDEPLQPPGGKWTHAGVVLGPRRAIAWRVLDAQYFGLAQRRKRVFVVASARSDFDPAAVLFEWNGVRRDSAPSREKRKGVAVGTLRGTDGGSDVAYGGNNTSGPIDIATACNAHGGVGRMDFESETFITHTLRGEGFDASEDGTGRGTPLIASTASVRRLTPRECERLQGFPDDYTAIPWRRKPASECPDGPRYKALGNSWAVPVVRWVGQRIDGALKYNG